MVLLILYILTLVITYFVHRKTVMFIDKENEGKYYPFIDIEGHSMFFMFFASLIPIVNIVVAIIVYAVVRIEESEEDFTEDLIRKFFFLKKKAE